MKPGDVIRLHRDEQITCLRSGIDGGPFEFEIRLGPGVEGPPMHSHAEGPEIAEVVSGAVVFRFAGGEDRLVSAGERLEIQAGQVHTFRNASKTEPVVFRGWHSHRFERSIDQFAPGKAGFTRMCRYVTGVDPQVTHMQSRVVRATMRVVAAIGRLRGVQTV